MGKYYSNPSENNFYRCFFQPFYCVAVFAECWHCGTLQIFVTRRPIRLFCWYLKALRWRSSMPDWDSNTYRYCVVLVPPEQQTLLRFHRKHSTCLVSPNIFTSGREMWRIKENKRCASNDRPMVYVCLHFGLSPPDSSPFERQLWL